MNKTSLIKVRVTPEEKAALEALAKARGVTVSRFFREAVQIEDATGGAVPARAWVE